MAALDLTAANLQSTIDNNDIVVIDFWAPWCAPCRMFKPVFEKAALNHPDMAFAKCNTEEQPQVAASFGIRSIPTLAIFREKVLVYMQPGAMPPAALEQLLTGIKALDMKEVRKMLAEEEKKLAGESGGRPLSV